MKDPHLLILETSGKRGQVGLALGDRLLGRRILEEGRRHAQDLAPAIQQLLHEQAWSPRQLDAILVSRGPGSYTGLRVGIMSAKTLAYALDTALLAVDTFAAIARQSPPECSRVDVLADAQKQDVYIQPLAREGEEWKPLKEIEIRSFEEWLHGREAQAWVTGPGLYRWRQQVPGSIRCVPEQDWQPRLESLLALGLSRYINEERDEVFALEPVYLRPSSAELQWRGPLRGRSCSAEKPEGRQG